MGSTDIVRAQLDAYRRLHGDEVGPDIVARWEGWLKEAWSAVQHEQTKKRFVELEAEKERRRLSHKYLRGRGIEIGALHTPLPLPPEAEVLYVDRCDTELLPLLYPEVAAFTFVPVDIVDDGEVLGTLEDSSVDFVIANHFLEHCQDPLGALSAHIRVLRDGGVLYCAVPDCRSTFDSVRERTTFDHLWRDHTEGPGWSRRAHYQDWTEKVSKRLGAEYEAFWRLLDALDYSIHFHVWSPLDFLDALLRARVLMQLPVDIQEFVQHSNECIVILRKM